MATPAMAWVLLSAEKQAVIRSQLDAILHSAPFRSSKRYPAMLEYCVQMTLAGDLEKLRERSIGMTLFSRPPGYETSSDPIVRMAASEIRKRLAQFYDDAQETSRVRIMLPPGSYVAEFRFTEPEDPIHFQQVALVVAETPAPEVPDGEFEVLREIPPLSSPSARVPFRINISLALAIMMFLALVGGTVVHFQGRRSALPRIWQGAAAGGNGQIVLVVGQLAGGQTNTQATADVPLQDDIFRARHFVSLEAASSSLTVCSAIAKSDLSCLLEPSPALDLSTVRHKPAIFLGAYNNPWTLRVAGGLPYRFGPFACKCIIDAKSSQSIAQVDFSASRENIAQDYSIVSRFHSDVTDGPVWVIAGLGPMSTVAAAEFTASKSNSEELLRLAPKGWAGENVEAVLATDLVKGAPGHTRILRTAFW